MDKVKVGVLGVGRGIVYVDNFLHLDNCVLVGVADRLEKRREQVRAKVEAGGGKMVREFEELLELKPDAIMVATDGRIHAEHSIQALNAGCHVLCEIPTGYDEDQLTRLRDTVDRTGKLYMAAENSCFLDFLRYWRKWLVEGKFGDVSFAHCEYIHYIRSRFILPDGRHVAASEMTEAERRVAVPDWRAAMPPIQYLTHDLGPLLEVLDDRAVFATCVSTPTYSKECPLRPDAQIALFETEKGRVIQCTVGLSVRTSGSQHHRYRIYGTSGSSEWIAHEETARAFLPECGGEKDRWVMTKLGAVAEGEDTSTGHGGVDIKVARTFLNAIQQGRTSPIDVYRGIEYTLPGIIAAQSADRGSARLPIPDLRRRPFTGTAFWDHVPLPEAWRLEQVRAAPRDE